MAEILKNVAMIKILYRFSHTRHPPDTSLASFLQKSLWDQIRSTVCWKAIFPPPGLWKQSSLSPGELRFGFYLYTELQSWTLWQISAHSNDITDIPFGRRIRRTHLITWSLEWVNTTLSDLEGSWNFFLKYSALFREFCSSEEPLLWMDRGGWLFDVQWELEKERHRLPGGCYRSVTVGSLQGEPLLPEKRNKAHFTWRTGPLLWRETR
jgi:hypothetical protein